MTPTSTPRPAAVVAELTRLVATGHRLDAPALYAERTDVSHPMHPELPVLRSRDDLRAHFAAGTGGPARTVVDWRLHETADPEVVVAEFAYACDDGTRTPCVFVVRVRDGLIVESRDYVGTPGPAPAT